jgi:hypothetical protein
MDGEPAPIAYRHYAAIEPAEKVIDDEDRSHTSFATWATL